MIEVEGDKVIDRDAEEELFGQLLAAHDERQLLLISDGRQRGKSTLLRKLKYHCDWKPEGRVPCALVRLDELADSHQFALIEALYDQLTNVEIEFPQFQRQRDAIRRRDPAGLVRVEGAHISGGQVAGVINNLSIPAGTQTVVVHQAATSWDASQESYAREEAIRLFFADLRQVCAEQLLVFLIDSVDEQANGKLVSWLLDRFVRAQLLDSKDPPQHFIMVLAGRSEQSPFAPFRQRYLHRVQSVERLGEWSNEHVRAFLELNRPAGAPPWPLRDKEIDFLRDLINGGDTLELAFSLVTTLSRRAAV